MQACTGNLPTGEEACHIGLSKQARLHSSTHVVLSWHDWDGLLGDVNATLLALSCNVWEVAHDLQGRGQKSGNEWLS